MPRDPLVLVAAAHHEAGDVLQEDQGDAPLRAELDEVRALLSGFREDDAVVGDDAHMHAAHLRESGNERLAEARLELVEARAVNNAGDDLANVVGSAKIGGDDAENIFGVVCWRLAGEGNRRMVSQRANGPPRQGERVRVVLGKVVGHARQAGVHVAPTQVLSRYHLASRSLHKRRTSEEDRPLIADDDRHVRHGRHVGAAGGAGAHDHGDLRDARRAHVGLVVEYTAEVVAVGEDLVLLRQVRAAGIDEVDAGQTAFRRDLLRPQMLLDGDRVVGPALHGRVVAHDHDVPPHDASHARDHAAAG